MFEKRKLYIKTRVCNSEKFVCRSAYVVNVRLIANMTPLIIFHLFCRNELLRYIGPLQDVNVNETDQLITAKVRETS